MNSTELLQQIQELQDVYGELPVRVMADHGQVAMTPIHTYVAVVCGDYMSDIIISSADDDFKDYVVDSSEELCIIIE